MEKIPRHIDIDYSKYAPDIPEDQLEAYYGLPKHVQFCKECGMSNQKPNSCYEFEHTINSIKKTMVIQDDGVCDACHAFHNKANGHIDWALREKELRELCDQYRKNDGSYDCLVPGSGGKDSHFQVWMLKEVMHMNPILFSVEDNFPMTQAGIHNLKNISEEFGCTIISCKPNIKVQKTLMRKFFEKYGKPTWYVARLIYTFPLHMAAKFNTPMLCYGENVS